jgi:predicted O-methyltransferase YrrM
MDFAELLRLLRLLPRRPLDALEQAATRFEAGLDRRLHPPPSYPSHLLADLLDGIERATGGLALATFLGEPAAQEVEEALLRSMSETGVCVPLPRSHDGDLTLGRLCYAACRAVRPWSVVETGVAYGVTSSFLLAALAVNGNGVLYSIDRPHPEPGADELVGSFVPAALRSRWTLLRGTSAGFLPRLTEELRTIGLFVHDSRHTYRNILRELRTVTPYLAPGAIVLADDVDRNAAFADWAAGAGTSYWATLRQAKAGSLAGVAVLRSGAGEGRA